MKKNSKSTKIKNTDLKIIVHNGVGGLESYSWNELNSITDIGEIKRIRKENTCFCKYCYEKGKEIEMTIATNTDHNYNLLRSVKNKPNRKKQHIDSNCPFWSIEDKHYTSSEIDDEYLSLTPKQKESLLKQTLNKYNNNQLSGIKLPDGYKKQPTEVEKIADGGEEVIISRKRTLIGERSLLIKFERDEIENPKKLRHHGSVKIRFDEEIREKPIIIDPDDAVWHNYRLRIFNMDDDKKEIINILN